MHRSKFIPGMRFDISKSPSNLEPLADKYKGFSVKMAHGGYLISMDKKQLMKIVDQEIHLWGDCLAYKELTNNVLKLMGVDQKLNDDDHFEGVAQYELQ